jgi:hypothetical protein
MTGSPSAELVNKILEGSDTEMIKLPTWSRIYFGNVCHPQGSEELEEIVKAYIPAREQSLVKLIELKDRIGADGLDLL